MRKNEESKVSGLGLRATNGGATTTTTGSYPPVWRPM
jgi:hypothetical protein